MIAVRWLLVVLLVVAASAAVWLSFRLDEPVRLAISAAHQHDWKNSHEGRFYRAVRVAGDWPPIIITAILGLAIARWRGSRRWTHLLAAAIISAAIAGLVAHASKATTGRTRPRESPRVEQGFYGVWHDGRLQVGRPGYNSFPSGHTATAFGFAFAVAFLAPLWGVAALALAALIAWSSIVTEAHHPSDVVVAIVLAGLTAWIVVRWCEGRGRHWLDARFRFPPES